MEQENNSVQNPEVMVEGVRGKIMNDAILEDMANVESLKAKQ